VTQGLDERLILLQTPLLRTSTANALDEAGLLEPFQSLTGSCGSEPCESGRIGDAQRHLDFVDQDANEAHMSC
jgi:hypothetical protein